MPLLPAVSHATPGPQPNLLYQLDDDERSVDRISGRLSRRECRIKQVSIPFDPPQMRGLSDAERSTIVAKQANLLMAAAGVAGKEASKDEQ